MQERAEVQAPDISVPFAWERFNSAKRSIAQIVSEMPPLREKIENLLPVSHDKARVHYDELVAVHGKLIENISVLRLCLLEMELQAEAAAAKALHSAVKAFAPMTPDYSRFSAAIHDYLGRLPGDDSDTASAKANASIIGRLMNNVRMGYYPTEPAHVDHIMRGIVFPDGITTNLLDPCCGCGIALRRLATGNNCMTYGVELDESRAEEAQERLHRVGVGSFYHAYASHEAFHLLFLNPPYLSVVTDGGKARSEKLFLVDSMKHLAIGGLMVYIIPYYRITADIGRILCDNFTDISVFRFMGKEFERFRQVAIFGIRQRRVDGAGEVEAFLESVDIAEEIPELSELPEDRYQLPAITLEVKLFKGAVFNELELQRQLKGSKSLSRLLERSALDSKEKRPLLPLKVGQIGLLAGSGMINGLAECDTPHIIKGRIVKKIQRAVDGEDGCLQTLTETHTNHMILNILTPEGFKSLN